MNVVNNNGRDLVYNPLQEVKGKFEMDFDDLRSKNYGQNEDVDPMQSA